MMRLLLCLLMFAFIMPSVATAAPDRAAELAQIQREKIKLSKIRKQLEAKLGALGKELRKLDDALVDARTAYRTVSAKVRETDSKISELQQSRRRLNTEIRRMESQMMQQAASAYQRANRQPGWLDLFVGVAVSEIPHRKKMLHYAMLSQEHDRQQWQKKVVELAEVERLEKIKRSELAELQRERRAQERQVARRVDEKRALAKRVSRDVGLNKKREKQLIEQEKALKRLIEGLSAGLLGSDKSASPQSVRKKRGKLAWPIRGKIVASFGSRPVPGRPKLTGVQLVPTGKGTKRRAVKAIADGQVRYADWFGGYGLMMIVDHGDGLISVYAHNDALYWQMGDWVEAGELLAEAGSTGWIEDVRLYFELRDKGSPVNPKKWCRR